MSAKRSRRRIREEAKTEGRRKNSNGDAKKRGRIKTVIIEKREEGVKTKEKTKAASKLKTDKQSSE